MTTVADISGNAPFAPDLPTESTAAVYGSFGATGQSASFRPKINKAFNASIKGTFDGTISLERSFNNVDWFICSADGVGTPATFTAPFSIAIDESEYGTLYRLNCSAYTSGAANYRIAQ